MGECAANRFVTNDPRECKAYPTWAPKRQARNANVARRQGLQSRKEGKERVKTSPILFHIDTLGTKKRSTKSLPFSAAWVSLEPKPNSFAALGYLEEAGGRLSGQKKNAASPGNLHHTVAGKAGLKQMVRV